MHHVIRQAWKLRYEDVLAIWSGCGAVWVTERGGGGSSGGGVEGQDGEDSEDEDRDEDMAFLRRNLVPALNVVEACLRAG